MASLPSDFRAQLALLVKQPPAGDGWLHELKFDGYRIGCRCDGHEVRLLSRNGNDWTAKFPEVSAAVRRLPARRFLLDGEVAVLEADGRTNFQALQNAFARTPGKRGLVYLVFDLLHLDGENIAALPLLQRKQRLRELLSSGDDEVLRYSDHVIGNGEAFFAQACQHKLEGIISKRVDQRYSPGRNDGWVKVKCIQRQEFIIGGFTDPEGSREGIGALLVGVRDAAGQLQFAGKVGTGFTRKSATELRVRLNRIERAKSPFARLPPGTLGRIAHWVEPSLLAEVAFSEWTEEGKIRHPSFQGLREDKGTAGVVRERPAEMPRAAAAENKMPNSKRAAGRIEVAGVSLSNPQRVLWPAVQQTKLDLARYYEEIAEWMLPHVAGRPLTLVRCPKGVGTSCFYMKHTPGWGAPAALGRVRIREKTKVGEYLLAESAAGLVALAQMDVLEVHTWNSTTAAVEQPDRLIFDLDPGPEVKWAQVIAAARMVRDLLSALQLKSFVKNTGGAGLHVVVPLLPEADWAQGLGFARELAELIERETPKLYTTNFTKRGREAKILVDYLRNNRTNTSVAAFSTRARERAPVSVPLDWDELSARRRSDAFTIQNVRQRLRELRRDPWRDYWRCQQRLPRTSGAR